MLSTSLCSFAVLLVCQLWGCNSTTEDKPSSSTSPTAPKNDGGILTKLLIDNLGTAGTFSEDFALVQKSNNANMRLPAQQLDYMFWKSRDTWSKSAKKSIDVTLEKRHKPPLFLIKYLLSTRLLANTGQIESDQCVSSVASTATMIFTDEQFPKSFNHPDSAPSVFLEACRTCFLFKTHSDCPGIALSTTLASLLMHVSTHKGAKNFVQDIHLRLIDSQRQFTVCKLDIQRDAHKSRITGLMNILKKALDPPPAGKCLQQHIQTILTQYIDFDNESQRTLEHCVPLPTHNLL
jgi:hypothetical protein